MMYHWFGLGAFMQVEQSFYILDPNETEGKYLVPV